MIQKNFYGILNEKQDIKYKNKNISDNNTLSEYTESDSIEKNDNLESISKISLNFKILFSDISEDELENNNSDLFIKNLNNTLDNYLVTSNEKN